MGRVQRNLMLERLAVLTDSARHVAQDQRRGAFGHLHILLRDYYRPVGIL
jgi:hypothetical protein